MSNHFDRYNTRAKINTRQRIYLADPETGAATGDWIDIRYSLADDYAEAREQITREIAIQGEDGGPAVERSARIIAPLIAAWSFDVPCDAVTVYEFLCLAPHMHNAIIEKATTEGKLYATASKPSASGQEASSRSLGRRKDQATE